MAMGDLGALGRLNAAITREAAFVAYIDDFKLMMFVTMTTIPLLLLLRNKPQKGPAEHVALD